VACPITSGDTAFRSARLTLADWFGISQKGFIPRLALALPLLAAGYAISFLDYGIVWRYFSWSNQTLAMIALWAGAVYLCRNVGPAKGFIAAIPAAFMSAVSITYFCIANECYPAVIRGIMSVSGWNIPELYRSIPQNISYGIGIGFAVLFFLIYWVKVYSPASKEA
jgi:carbon starvation protein CstA